MQASRWYVNIGLRRASRD